MLDIDLLTIADSIFPGRDDRPRARRRQCHRHRACGRGPARRPAQQGDPRRHQSPPPCCGSALPAITVQLLQIVGLLLAGGILLLWVCWKMWRELQASHRQQQARFQKLSAATNRHCRQPMPPPERRWVRQSGRSRIADVSMSLDNVLAVAGAAREHPMILVFGLAALDRADGARRQLHRAACCRSIAGSPMSAS